jgi:hypothetical protein
MTRAVRSNPMPFSAQYNAAFPARSPVISSFQDFLHEKLEMGALFVLHAKGDKTGVRNLRTWPLQSANNTQLKPGS